MEAIVGVGDALVQGETPRHVQFHQGVRGAGGIESVLEGAKSSADDGHDAVAVGYGLAYAAAGDVVAAEDAQPNEGPRLEVVDHRAKGAVEDVPTFQAPPREVEAG